jgi:hypothetical protein
MKIALVKSEYYSDLYRFHRSDRPDKTIFSSLMRSGPVALLVEHGADFIVIKADRFSNDVIWREKIEYCGQGNLAHYLEVSRRECLIDGVRVSNASSAVSADCVDWGKYDIVVCIDACIGKEVTVKHSRVRWAYYISEGCMPEAARSRKRPVEGYDIFLNQRFRTADDYAIDPNLAHEIDFPYHLNSPAVMRKLIGDRFFDSKDGIFVDKDSRQYLTDEHVQQLQQFGTVRFTGGTIDVVLTELAMSKYYLRLGDKPIWGNASIEAAACEAVQITSERGYRNRIFCFPENSVGEIKFNQKQFDQAILRIHALESSSVKYRSVLERQNSVCTELCYLSPMRNLIDN